MGKRGPVDIFLCVLMYRQLIFKVNLLLKMTEKFYPFKHDINQGFTVTV